VSEQQMKQCSSFCFKIFVVPFSEGKWLVMSTTNGTIHLIDSLAGEEKKKVNAKSTGIGQLRFTHHELCVLTTGDKMNQFDVRYLCLYDNRYLRLFSGHNDFITSLSMCPTEDTFLTASNDRTVRRWDLSSPKETARIQLPSSYGVPVVSYDSSGVIFGVLSQNLRDNSHSLRLYDARNYSTGPFQDITPPTNLQLKALQIEYPHLIEETLSRPPKCNWTGFEFSSDGSHILINTDSEIVWLIDSFRNDIQPQVFGPRKNDSNLKLGCCLSTDCETVLVGNEDNEIQLFNKTTNELKSVLTGHVSPVGCVAFNPKYDVFASACGNTVLWIPKGSS
jgi:COMPASS component SWD2